MTAPIIQAPAWLGVVGGGPQARLFILAAQAAGYRPAVYTDSADSPAARAADRCVVGSYDDPGSVAHFAKTVDALTFEFESISPLAAYAAGEHTLVRPQPRILATAQHRLREMQFLRSRGFPTAPFFYVQNGAELERALVRLGWNAVFKAAVRGSEGLRQVRIEGSLGLERAWGMVQSVAGLVEGGIDCRCRLSVVVARSERGEIAVYGPFRNEYSDFEFEGSVYPAMAGDRVDAEAVRLTIEAAEALRLEGVLAVEMLLDRGGRLLINEIAPHPHESGNLTLAAFASSQFDQQVCTLCGLELAPAAPIARAAAMARFPVAPGMDGVADPAPSMPDAIFVHFDDPESPHRSGGGVTALAETVEAAQQQAKQARDRLVAARKTAAALSM